MSNLKKNLIEDLRKNTASWIYLVFGIFLILCPIPGDIPEDLRAWCAAFFFFGGMILMILSILCRMLNDIADMKGKIKSMQSYLERLGCDGEDEKES